MKILICCATGGELKVVKEEIKKLNLKVHLPIEYFCTGMGNHATIFSLTKKILENPDRRYIVVNIGVCGYRGDYEKVVQLATLQHTDLQKEIVIPIIFSFAPFRKCISGEQAITFEEGKSENNVVMDMESYGIEYVCQQFQLPRIYVKVPVDGNVQETKKFDQKKALEMLGEYIDWKLLVEELVTYLSLYIKTCKSQEIFCS